MKTAVLATLLLSVFVASTRADLTGVVDLSKIDRSIAKEPRYQNEPHYALIVFGPQAQHRSWLVLDGDNFLYFDRNGNGDLTDPEDRLEHDPDPSKQIMLNDGSGYSGFNVFEIGVVAGVKLQFQLWVRKRGFTPADEWRQKLIRERDDNNWEIGTLLRIAADGTGIQNPTVMVVRPNDAQITHLNGPLTFGLKWGARQKLQPWPQATTFDVNIGTPILPARSVTHEQFSALSVSELPNHVHPTAVFEFPGKGTDGKPLVQTIELDQRCCGDTLYAQLSVPRSAGVGMTKVTLTYANAGRVIHPATFEVPIGGPRNNFDSETSYVMFQDPKASFGLDDAMVAMRVGGFKVQKESRFETVSLHVQSEGRPEFVITLNRKPEVREVATALGESDRLSGALKQSDARFEIVRLSNGTDLKEKELSQIHKILQQETHGIIYTPWDQRLTGVE